MANHLITRTTTAKLTEALDYAVEHHGEPVVVEHLGDDQWIVITRPYDIVVDGPACEEPANTTFNINIGAVDAKAEPGAVPVEWTVRSPNHPDAGFAHVVLTGSHHAVGPGRYAIHLAINDIACVNHLSGDLDTVPLGGWSAETLNDAAALAVKLIDARARTLTLLHAARDAFASVAGVG